MKNIKKTYIVILIITMAIFIIPIPRHVELSGAGFCLCASDLTYVHPIHMEVNLRITRSLAGFERITGSISIDGDVMFESFVLLNVFDEFEAAFADTRYGAFQGINLLSERGKRGEIEPGGLFFGRSFDFFAVSVWSRENEGHFYYVITSETIPDDVDVIDFFSDLIPNLCDLRVRTRI